MTRTRREFLEAGRAAVVCACASAVAGCARPTVKANRLHYEGVATARKALVLYGTRAGSTAEVAEFVGRCLSASGWSVDVEPVGAAKALGGYDAAVIGSAVRKGSVLPEVQDLVKTRKAELQRMSVAYFITCMTLREDTPEHRARANGFLAPLRSLVEPSEAGLFAGKMDYSKLDAGSRLMAKVVGIPRGDFRDWTAIATWAGLVAALGRPRAETSR